MSQQLVARLICCTFAAAAAYVLVQAGSAYRSGYLDKPGRR